MLTKELLEGLTEEQVRKLSTCKSNSEFLKIAKEEGIELNEAQLSAFSGGESCLEAACPHCGCKETELHTVGTDFFYACPKCGKIF